MAEEEEEESKAGHGLFRKLLAVNYYEVVEPFEFKAEPLELRKVPNSFASAQVPPPPNPPAPHPLLPGAPTPGALATTVEWRLNKDINYIGMKH